MRRHATRANALLAIGFVFASLSAVLGGLQDKSSIVPSSSIEGTVIDLERTTPISGASVALAGPVGSPIFTKTDESGHFIFRGLLPDRYNISAQYEGYHRPSRDSGPTRLTVQNQQRIENVTIGLAHSAAIGGRVYGINGIPLAEMTVEALQVGYRDVRRKLIAVGKRATTDDRGEYRIYWLSPGEYYIRASFASRPSPRAAQGVVYGATYYPGVVDPVSAAPVVLRSGTEITNVDFMANANSGFRVSGPVVSSATKIGPRQSVGLVYVTPHDVNSVEDLTAFINSSAKPDVFEISGLKPGSYDLFPFLLTPLGRVLVDRIPVVVVNQDVTVAAASLGPGIEVKGTIVSQATNGVRPPSLRIGLTSLDNLPNLLTPYSAEVDSEGAFELTGVHDARYGFMVLGLPRDWFVVDVRHPGESVYDDGLIVGGTPPVPVEVIISPGGGKVEGTVLDSQGKIRANAIVTLVPAPTHRKNPFLYKRDVSDQSGHFTIEGIAPGEYKVFAWNSMSQPAYQNAEFISAYEQRGILLQVTKDAKLDAGVRLISNQNDQN